MSNTGHTTEFKKIIKSAPRFLLVISLIFFFFLIVVTYFGLKYISFPAIRAYPVSISNVDGEPCCIYQVKIIYEIRPDLKVGERIKVKIINEFDNIILMGNIIEIHDQNNKKNQVKILKVSSKSNLNFANKPGQVDFASGKISFLNKLLEDLK